jgi:hypothetical protein
MSIQTALKIRLYFEADGTATSYTCALAGSSSGPFVVMSEDAPVAVIAGSTLIAGGQEFNAIPTGFVPITAGVTASVSGNTLELTFATAPAAGSGHVDGILTFT